MQFKTRPANAAVPWWINPSWFVVCFVLPMFILISFMLLGLRGSPTIRYQYSAPLYVEPFDIAMLSLCILSLALGAVIAGGLQRRTISPQAPRIVTSETGLYILFFATIIAYTLWFGISFIRAPALILGALRGDIGSSYIVRSSIKTIPGVTTLTQFGVSYVLIVASLVAANIRLKPRFIAFAIAIVVLAVLRALIWSERIAVIELLFPSFVVIAARIKVPTYTKPIVNLGPYFGAAVMPILFIAFEINRSWSTHYSKVYNNIAQFTIDRIVIYYISAINNGIGYLKNSVNPTFTGEFTINWLYEMPFIGDPLRDLTDAHADTDYIFFLRRSADPEFNNYTGISLIAHDWGWVPTLLFFFAYGLIVGAAYRSFLNRRNALGIIFPLLMYAIYEVLRIGYVNESRFFVAVIGVMLYWSIGSSQKRKLQPQGR